MSLPPFRRKPRARRDEERPIVPIDDAMLLWIAAALIAFMMLLAAQAGTAAAAKRLPAPKQSGPSNGATVKVAPTFAWAPVKGAARYEFQLAADDKFESIVGLRREGTFKTKNTFATVPLALAESPPSHGYFWRVRAIDAKDAVGRWSRVSKIVKSWPDVPEEVVDARANPEVFAGKSLGQIDNHFAEVIGALEK